MTASIVVILLVILLLDSVIIFYLEKFEPHVYDEIGRPLILWNGMEKSFYMTKFILMFGFLGYELSFKFKFLCALQSMLGWIFVSLLAYITYCAIF